MEWICTAKLAIGPRNMDKGGGTWGKRERTHLKSPYLGIQFSIFRGYGCSSAQVSSSFTISVTLITLASHFIEPSVTY